MITTGSKLWFGVTAFALGALILYFVASGGEEHGSMVLLFAVVAAALLGTTTLLLRDGTVPAPDGEQPAPAVAEPRTPSAPWPALGALGVATAVIGLAAGGALFYVGLGILAVTLVEWMVQGWAERSTADPAENVRLRNRLMYPIEIPALAVIGVAFVVLTFSRVLLALPKVGSTVIAIVVAALILAVASVLASRPRLSSSALTGVAVAGAVAMLGGGIVGAVAGERDFEVHGAEHDDGQATGHASDEGEGGEEQAPAGAEEVVITASGLAFDTTEVEVPLGQPVTLRFENHDDQNLHNVRVQGLPGGEEPATEVVGPGDSSTTELNVSEPGSYTFICDVHPVQMQGTIVVAEETTADGSSDADAPPSAEPDADASTSDAETEDGETNVGTEDEPLGGRDLGSGDSDS